MDLRSSSRAVDAGLALLLTLVALAIRVRGLSEMRLIDDELIHLALAHRPLEFIFQASYTSPVLPAWPTLYHFWLLLLGSGAGVKAFALLWGVLAVPCTYGMARAAAGRKAAVLAALLLALNGFGINFSQTATMYSFLLFLGAAAGWLLLVVLRDGSRRAAVLHTIVLAVAFYTHQSGALLWGAELAAVLLLVLLGRRTHLRLVSLSLAAALVLAVGAAHMLANQWGAYKGVGLPYVPEASLSVVLEKFHGLLAFQSSIGWAYALEALFALAAVGGGLAATARVLRGDADGRWPLVVMLVVWLLPFTVCVAMSLLVSKDLLYASRFFAISLPAGIALLAGTIAWVDDGPRLGWLRRPLAVALLAAALIPQAGSMAFMFGGDRAKENFPIDEISAYLEQHSQPQDVAVVHHSYCMFFFARYYHAPWPRFQGAVQQGFDLRPLGGLYHRTTPPAVRDALKRAGGYRRIWLILTPSTNDAWRDPEKLIERAFDQRFELKTQRCFSCDGGDPVLLKLYLVRE